jgi:hypothetical protein
VRLQDVAEVYDGVENVRNLGTFNGQPAILVQITKQPGANVIEVVDRYPRPASRAAKRAAGQHRLKASCSTPPPRSATRCTMSKSA